MRYIVQQLVASGESLALGTTPRFYVEDRRKQRNLERVMACPSLTTAALNGVISDHRVVETLSSAESTVRSIVLQVEAKLGRRLGRERAQKLLAAYDRVRAARLRPQAKTRKAKQSHQPHAAL